MGNSYDIVEVEALPYYADDVSDFARYRIHARWDSRSLETTAAGMLNLANWIEQHRSQLEQEAQAEIKKRKNLHSFYLLELSVVPGCSRKGDEYFFGSLEEVMEALHEDLSLDTYHALIYGEDINLSVYYEGRRIWSKALHPYIVFHVPGFPPLHCDENGVRDFDPALVKRLEDEDTEEEEDEYLKDELEERDPLEACKDYLFKIIQDQFCAEGSQWEWKIPVDIDWAAMEIPKLEGKLASPGEKVYYLLEDNDYDEVREAEYGANYPGV